MYEDPSGWIEDRRPEELRGMRCGRVGEEARPGPRGIVSWLHQGCGQGAKGGWVSKARVGSFSAV